MITLQDLIDLAKEHNLNPNQCVILCAQPCANGDIQYDYLYETRVVCNEEVIDENEEFVIVKNGIALEVFYGTDES